MSSDRTAGADLSAEVEELRRRNAELYRTLDDVGRFYEGLAQLRGLTTPAEVHERVLALAASLIPCRQAHLLVHDPASGRFAPAARRGPPIAFPVDHLVDPALIAWAFGIQNASVVPVESHPLDEGGVRSLVLGPMACQGRPVALLVLGLESEEQGVERIALDLVWALSREAATVLDRLRLTERVRGLVTLLDNVLESVPHAILAIGRDDRIIACNSNAEFLFNFKRFLALGERYQDVFPAEVARVFHAVAVSALEGRATHDVEVEHRITEATTLTVGFSASILADTEGQPYGLVFICRDMSLSREVEKLRELDRMKSEFVQTVSHELKTPLTAILGGTEVLLVDEDTMDPSQVEVVKIIEDGARRLQALISDLLDLSRLESGRIVLEERPTDVAGLLAETCPAMAPPDGPHRLVLDLPEEHRQVYVDPGKIQQVMENLISNAVKYSPRGGEVHVALRYTPTHVEVAVSDEGIGIAPEHHSRIWDKFYRVDSSTTAEIEGTGLGLAIVRHIVEMHGGTIGVESDPASRPGSTFRMALPLKGCPQDEL
ncbi:MAG: PAS domain-containing protein [Planctomycetes bacterium]|nr:PAS domain-containing protein [Planctomycetota bacterium]